MSQVFVAARTLLYAAGFLTLWGWLARRARHLDMERGLYLPFWTGFIGIGAFLAGALVVLSCVVSFVVAGKGTPAPFDPPRRFVASGPYRFVRNPMYLGSFLLLSGYGLYARSPSVLGLTALAALSRPSLRRPRRGAGARAPVRGELPRVQALDEPLDPAPPARRLSRGASLTFKRAAAMWDVEF